MLKLIYVIRMFIQCYHNENWNNQMIKHVISQILPIILLLRILYLFHSFSGKIWEVKGFWW